MCYLPLCPPDKTGPSPTHPHPAPSELDNEFPEVSQGVCTFGKVRHVLRNASCSYFRKNIMNDGEMSTWKWLCLNKGLGPMDPGETVGYWMEHEHVAERTVGDLREK